MAKKKTLFTSKEKTKDIEVVFEAALNGHAEEISISKLVQFYLSNT